MTRGHEHCVGPAGPALRRPRASCVETPERSVDGKVPQSELLARAGVGGGGGLIASLLRRRTVRYALVSGVSVTVAQLTLVVAFGALHWDAVPANVLATAVATVPSYSLNRAWVWGKRGKSHLLKEVVPFCGLTLLGLGVSTLGVAAGERWAAELSADRLVQTGVVSASALLSFGFAWIGKFVVLHHVLFVPAATDVEPAISAESA